jgi:hypothetical protein
MSPNREGRRVAGAVVGILCAAALAQCNFIVGAGDYAVGDTGQDGASSQPVESGGSQPPDAMESGGACTAVASSPAPAHGGPACPQADSSTCWPHDATAFAANWVPAIGAHLGVCTAAQVSGYYSACEDTTVATKASCDAWTQANAACFACLYTPASAASYGAIIGFSQEETANEAGCLALVEACNLPCAQAMLALNQCEEGACGTPNCTDYASFSQCTTQADTCSTCSDYVTPASCSQSILGSDHPAATICGISAITFKDTFTAIATFMCGT